MNFGSYFSGIGAFERGFEKAGIDFNLQHYCELDKYASKAYSLIHNEPETKNLGDITKVNIAELEPHSADVITYGFPCQDISVAGKQKGFTDENGNCTRSGLFFYAAAIIGRIQPKVAICENVKALTSKKFTEEFATVLSTLEEMGYTNYWQVLNAKDYGIPQNRERVFIVSVRNDIDKKYVFPTPVKLELRLKDILEKEVDEKYYLSDKALNGITNTSFSQKQKIIQDGDVCATILSRDYKDPKCVRVSQNVKAGYAECKVGGVFDASFPSSKTRRGRVQDGGETCPTLTASGQKICHIEPIKPVLVGGIGEKNFGKQYRQGNRIYDGNAIGMALNAQPVGNAGGNSYLYKVGDNKDYRIRKLTPKECWRLMGFEDADIDKCIDAKISNTQLYKMAGNSIVTNVVEAIARQLIECGIL